MSVRLGAICKIVYNAKNNKTGLSGIVSRIMMPNGTVLGPFALAEFTDANFKGSYFYNYLSNATDPEGDYIVSTFSPNEGNHNTRNKFSLFKSTSGGSGYDLISDEFLQGEISSDNLNAEINENISLQGIVYENDLIGSVLFDEILIGAIEDNDLVAQVECM